MPQRLRRLLHVRRSSGRQLRLVLKLAHGTGGTTEHTEQRVCKRIIYVMFHSQTFRQFSAPDLTRPCREVLATSRL
jgi:ribosomal protein S10